jgi:predicted ATPase
VALRYSAVELFNERATASTDSFMINDGDVPAPPEICRRLEGVPLALRLARLGSIQLASPSWLPCVTTDLPF